MDKKTIIIEAILHKGKQRQAIRYPYNPSINEKVKQISGREWSQTLKCWHLPFTVSKNELVHKLSPHKIKFIENDILQKTQLYAKLVIDKKDNKIQLTLSNDEKIKSSLSQIVKNYRLNNYPKWFFTGTNNNYLKITKLLALYNYKYKVEYKRETDELQDKPIVKQYVQAMIMRNNSKNTINIYTPIFTEFVMHFKNDDINTLTYEEINAYVQSQIKSKQLKETQQKQLISAIKYYYEKIQGKDKLYFNLQNKAEILDFRCKIPFSDLIQILKVVENSKEKLLLIFHYSFGLTPTEISTLTLKDSKKKIQTNKDNKSLLLNLVTDYYKQHKPVLYFFETNRSTNYSLKNIENHIFRITNTHQLIEIHKQEYLQICKLAKIEESSSKNYTSYFLTFLKHFKFVHPLSISNEQIRAFLIMLNKKEYSKNTIHQYINSIKLYYERTGKREIETEFIFRPKKERKLPEILSLDEINRLLSNIENIKHHCILALTYSAGLRRSETLNLKIHDLDMSRNEIRVKNGKGKKDRITLLSEALKEMLLLYIKEYKPQEYLFEGATGNKYSTSSMDKILKNALKNAKIEKHITLHSLRHSFATHLLEQGTDIRFIQELLGHANIKTTVLYTKVAQTAVRKIKNPLDNILNKKDNNAPP